MTAAFRRAAAAGLAASLLAAGAAEASAPAQSDCFWLGPIQMGSIASTVDRFDGRNFNFPEESAIYWLARLDLPPGARLTLRGAYPHARYMSLNSYAGGGAPAFSLPDTEIAPDAGASNPFRHGALRTGARRSWTVRYTPERLSPLADKAPNTLYGPGGDVKTSEVVLRVYEPDRGRDRTGGAGLPVPEVTFADGSKATGTNAVCAAVNAADRTLKSTVQSVPASAWQTLTRTPGGDAATSPALNPVLWERFFNQNFAAGIFQRAAGKPRPLDNMTDIGGFFSNADTRYVLTHLSRRFGRVLVIRARMPTFPATYAGARRMPGGQVRFWSLCSGESRVTTRTPDCLADRQVPLGPGRTYTIAVSTRADRPRNARPACGIAWLDWGSRGDAAGRKDYGLLIMRNMLASPSFRHAIQNVRRLGDERRVMGPYFPSASYTSRGAFERRGC